MYQPWVEPVSYCHGYSALPTGVRTEQCVSSGCQPGPEPWDQGQAWKVRQRERDSGSWCRALPFAGPQFQEISKVPSAQGDVSLLPSQGKMGGWALPELLLCHENSLSSNFFHTFSFVHGFRRTESILLQLKHLFSRLEDLR